MRLRLVPWFGDKPVGAVTRKDCDAYAFDRVTNGSSAPGDGEERDRHAHRIHGLRRSMGLRRRQPRARDGEAEKETNAMAVLDAQQL